MPHRQASIPISTKMCTLPCVSTNSPRNTQGSKPKALSRINRRVGLREDPGVRMVEYNGSGCVTALLCGDGQFAGVFAMMRRVESQATLVACANFPRIYHLATWVNQVRDVSRCGAVCRGIQLNCLLDFKQSKHDNEFSAVQRTSDNVSRKIHNFYEGYRYSWQRR